MKQAKRNLIVVAVLALCGLAGFITAKLRKNKKEVVRMNRRNVIQSRVTDRELAQIRMKMRQMGIHNLSAYIRKMAIDGYCIRLDAAELMRLSTLLRRCSNNLNQYAKVANTNGHIYHEDIEALKKGQEEIWLSLQKLLAEIADIGQEGGAHGGNQTDRNA